MSDWRTVPTLVGEHVRLEPLARAHADGLRAAAADGELWKLWYTSVPAPAAAEAYIDTALAAHAEGKALPFVVKDAAGTVVGSTRFGNVEAAHRRLEIGWTWYAKRVQRTALNTEAKRLLLTHAFEMLGANVVQLCTHWFNQRSREAIARLGAKQDGVLRSHMLMPDGGVRDTVVFSIIACEWPAVRQNLDARLGRGVPA
jgi:RimJ/RimL family protein N-acetyltransferase